MNSSYTESLRKFTSWVRAQWGEQPLLSQLPGHGTASGKSDLKVLQSTYYRVLCGRNLYEIGEKETPQLVWRERETQSDF